MPTKPLPSRNILAGSGTGTPGPPGTLSVPVPNWNTTLVMTAFAGKPGIVTLKVAL